MHSAKQPGKIMIIGATSDSMVGFRAALIRGLLRKGHGVTCVAPGGDKRAEQILRAWGAEFVQLPLERNGMNPLRDLRTLLALYRLVATSSPDVVFSYNIKPLIYGSLAARLAGVPRSVVMVEGLGYAYSPGKELRRRLARIAADLLYRLPCALADGFIVLNQDDYEHFASRLLSKRRERLHVIPGIGVDLEAFACAPLPAGPVTFVMIGRLLRDKGVMEFLSAAREVREQGHDARFVLVGGTDANPTSVQLNEIAHFIDSGIVTYAGGVSDVRPWLYDSHVFVLPTKYREGVPRTIIEALATGRPCITTDVPGCRDIVVDGFNGLLVPPGNVEALSAAMVRMIRNRHELSTFADNASRDRARLDADAIATRTLDILWGHEAGQPAPQGNKPEALWNPT